MYVIGTAGHVDHGKSTLVEALTNIDPDRLREEKVRGMTIDLGFAWLRLPGGEEVSIVDVPGHERFVNNMLAGVGGIDLALLVVAADESVMPQTREHLAILDLLKVKNGLVAVTKKDLVDAEWLELVSAEVEELLEGTVLEGARIVPVSGTTREGLDDLVAAIEGLLGETGSRKDLARPRLPIDRSFTMSGFGTVVTGTLIDGSLNVGQEIVIEPSGETARIRGLQSHKKSLDRAEPGSRVAANLSGIDHGSIARGEVLTLPGWLQPTEALDVRLRVLEDVPRALRHNMFLTVHTGSSEIICRLRLLEDDRAEPGQSVWAQLKLDRPVAAVKGDFFIVRSNRGTLGGGVVVDPRPRRHRRRHAPILERLEVMEQGSVRDVLLQTIEASEPAEFGEMVKRANLAEKEARSELEGLASERLVIALGGPSSATQKEVSASTHLFTAGGWASMAGKSSGFLEEFHRRYPLRKGAPKEELRSRLGLSAQVLGEVLPRLQDDGVLVEEGAVVRLPEHRPQVTDTRKSEVDGYLERLASSPYSPPTDAHVDAELLGLLVDDGRVVKVSDSVVFEAEAYADMLGKIEARARESGEITVGDVRDMFATSRKYALALLEHLDRERVTRRVGDARVLR